MKKINFPASLIALGAMIFFAIPSTGQAVGVSPAEVQTGDVLKGQERIQTVQLFRDAETEGDLTLNIEVTGDYKNLIQTPDQITIPAGQSSQILSFVVKTNGINAGEYNIPIYAKEVNNPNNTNSQSDNGNHYGQLNNGDTTVTPQVTIVKAVKFNVKLKITEAQKASYSILGANVRANNADNTLSGYLYIRNTGNVAWKPSKVNLELKHQYSWINSQTNNIEVPTDDMSLIAPGEFKAVKFTVPNTLPKTSYNAYRGKAMFYDADQLVKTINLFTFRF